MRSTLTIFLTIWCTIINAFQIADHEPFLEPFDTFDNSTHHDILKRQSSGCPANYNNCANLGAPGLCCAASAVCSADALSHVACCRSGSSCTGTIGGYITAGTISDGYLITGGTAAVTATTSSNYGLQSVQATTTTTPAVTTTGNGFIIASNSVVAQPAAAGRGFEVPVVMKLISRTVQLIPIW